MPAFSLYGQVPGSPDAGEQRDDRSGTAMHTAGDGTRWHAFTGLSWVRTEPVVFCVINARQAQLPRGPAFIRPDGKQNARRGTTGKIPLKIFRGDRQVIACTDAQLHSGRTCPQAT